MFQFPAFASYPYVFESKIPYINTWKPLWLSSRPKAYGRCAKRLATRFSRCIGILPYRPEAVGDRSPYRWTKGPTTKKILQVFKVGCPIRKSMDQSLFAAPHSLSQRITSFFACACQGIHQMPLIHLFVLIVYAHPYLLGFGIPILLVTSKGFQIGHKTKVTFYNFSHFMMP
jgi:hypothetical protein